MVVKTSIEAASSRSKRASVALLLSLLVTKVYRLECGGVVLAIFVGHRLGVANNAERAACRWCITLGRCCRPGTFAFSIPRSTAHLIC